MLAHNLKEIFSIVPSLKDHIKQANIEEDYPLDNKEGCLASYLRCYYLTKIAGKTVDPDIISKLEKASKLYGIAEEAKPFVDTMDKYASEKRKQLIKQAEEIPVKIAQSIFEGSLTGFFDVEKASKQAQGLMLKYAEEVTSDEVKRYAGKAYFNKKAALEALDARATASGNPVFTKVAAIIEKNMEVDSPHAEILDVCERVTQLDKKAGLLMKGFNFYKEALAVKPQRLTTALSVNICGKPCPYEKIQRLGKHRISAYLGKDVADQMTDNPVLNKRIIESLPLDLQRVLAGILKSV